MKVFRPPGVLGIFNSTVILGILAVLIGALAAFVYAPDADIGSADGSVFVLNLDDIGATEVQAATDPRLCGSDGLFYDISVIGGACAFPDAIVKATWDFSGPVPRVVYQTTAQAGGVGYTQFGMHSLWTNILLNSGLTSW